MKIKTKYLLVLLLLLFGRVNLVYAQKEKKASKRDQAYYDKQKEKEAEKVKKGEEEAKELHIKRQSKEVQKRMKRSEKKSKRILKRKNSNSLFRVMFRKR